METKLQTSSQTAIGQALRDAGYEPPEDRLLDLLDEAWRKWPSLRDGAGARRDFVIARLAGEMTFVLVKQWQQSAIVQCVGYALNATKPEPDAGKPAGGQIDIDTQQQGAPVPSRDTGHSPVGGGQVSPDTQLRDAPANPSRDDVRPRPLHRSESAIHAVSPRQPAPAAPNLRELADKQQARSKATVETMIRLSKLDTVMVWDRKIGDCTVSQVREWAKHRETERRHAGRDTRFAWALVANLPSGAVIRDHWKDLDEVTKIYAKAEAEYAA